MRIIIVGAGKIGTKLAQTLSEENNEVYLIEHHEPAIRKLGDKLDAKIIFGNGAEPNTLAKANIQDADLVLAVTTSDETNLVVCCLAELLGAKRRIARIRNMSLSATLTKFGATQFKIDEMINPELVAARSIVKTIQSPGSSEVADFASGQLLLRGCDVPAESPLCHQRLEELRDEDFPWPFLIVAIFRDKQLIIPKGSDTIEPNDHIYVMLPAQSHGEFLSFINPSIKMPKKVIIYGASITGIFVAQALRNKVRDIILVEENSEQASNVAGDLEDVRVINGSATETDILAECGAEVADVFIGASDNDHANLISSVLAKNMGVKITIITTQQPDYLSIMDSLDVDAVINPQHLAVEQILHLVRGRGVSSVIKFFDCEAEAVEFVVQKNALITREKLKDINFPKDSIVGAVIRGNDVFLAKGDTHIQSGDRAIVFCRDSVVKKAQTLFTQK